MPMSTLEAEEALVRSWPYREWATEVVRFRLVPAVPYVDEQGRIEPTWDLRVWVRKGALGRLGLGPEDYRAQQARGYWDEWPCIGLSDLEAGVLRAPADLLPEGARSHFQAEGRRLRVPVPPQVRKALREDARRMAHEYRAFLRRARRFPDAGPRLSALASRMGP